MRGLALLRLLPLATLAWLPASAVAGECDQLANLAQQTAALYSRSGDPAHRAAAQNYRSGYNACVNSSRASAPSYGGGDRAGAALGALGAMMGILGTLNSGDGGARQREIEQYEREQAARRELERDLRRIQEEHEAEQREEAARLAEEERQRQEQARRHAAEEADRQARCAAPNRFGSRAAAGCDVSGAPAPSPFRTCPKPLSSGCDWGNGGPGGPTAEPSSRFATQSGGEGDTKSRFAQRAPASPGPAPALAAGAAANAMYDSVRKVPCPDGIAQGCIADGWRQALAAIAEHDGNLAEAIRAARYKAPDYSLYAITTEQYERLGRGEATFEEIQDENLDRFADDLMRRLESQMAVLRSDPETRKLAESLKRQ